jgi:hypothetical protein
VPTPLIIDCDPGIDDMMALLVACASPEVELLGVGTVAGNVEVDTATGNALSVLALAGRSDVPVARGCARTGIVAGTCPVGCSPQPQPAPPGHPPACRARRRLAHHHAPAAAAINPTAAPGMTRPAGHRPPGAANHPDGDQHRDRAASRAREPRQATQPGR